MSVLGFAKACRVANQIIISEDPKVIIPVASPPEMALLKLIVWLDRPSELRAKDARDLTYLCESYEQAPSVIDVIYDKMTNELEMVDWDIRIMET